MSVSAKLLAASFSATVFVSTALNPAFAEQTMSSGSAAGRLVLMPMVGNGVVVRQVNSVGQTKPRGSSLDVRGGTTRALDERSRRLNWLINNSICSGCLPNHL